MENTKKSVLMFCADFFGYREQIVNQLHEDGWKVDLYDERPATDVVSKILMRLNAGIIRPKVKKYFQRIIEENKDKCYDYVFVIKGEAIDEENVAMLRSAFPNATFVLYLWDSVRNIPGGEKKISCYDRVLTFDRDDAVKYNIPFRPLYYGSGFEQAEKGTGYDYDICFIGTAHSIRPRLVKQIEAECVKLGLSCYHYLYLPHPLVYLYHRVTNSNYQWVKDAEIHFEPLPREKVQEYYRRSRCILDIEHPNQKGITSRPLEMLKMQKKVITTNRQITEYDFYKPENFLVIDPENPCVNVHFFERDYVPASEEILQKYSVKGFIEEVLY